MPRKPAATDLPPTEAIELAAVRDIFLAAPRELAERHGIELAEVDGVTLTAVRDLPSSSMLDRAVGLGTRVPAGEDTLDAICAWYRERGVDLFVPLAPGARPETLPDRLAARGFEPAWGWMKFLRGVEPLAEPRSPLRARPAGRKDACSFGRIVAAGFGLPEWTGDWLAALVGRRGWRVHLACEGETPAGAAALFVRGQVGYLAFGSVLPEHRGKGAQRALLAARIGAARELGCRLLVTETGARLAGKPAFSYCNILRAGFAEQYVRPNYVRRFAAG